jgi:hypothetical protein
MFVDVTLKILAFKISKAEEDEEKIFKPLYILGGHLALLNQLATWRAPRPFSSVRFGSIPVYRSSSYRTPHKVHVFEHLQN